MIVDVRDVLLYFSLKYDGNFEKSLEGIKNKEHFDEDLYEKLIGQVKSKALCLTDDRYPNYFKALHKPPLVLYYYGNLSLLEYPRKLGVIGARKASCKASSIVSQLFKDVSSQTVIVSGMAVGCDSLAQREWMRLNRPVISILGSGIDCCYPGFSEDIYEYCKTDKGLVISEYPGNVIPNKEHFPKRNRLIAAVSDSLLVLEAKVHSGTQITVNYALDMGKDILAVPRDIDSTYDLTNRLIKQGALPCLSSSDIEESLK